MQQHSSAVPVQLTSDQMFVFDDVAIDFTGLPAAAFSDEPNQAETESFGVIVIATHPTAGATGDPPPAVESV